MFTVSRRLDGQSTTIEYGLATDAEAIALGEALTITAGRLTKCGPTATPDAIAVGSCAAGTSQKVPFVRTNEVQEFETTAGATVAPTLIGSKVTIGADGLTCTATTTSGVFNVSSTDGATGGGKVRGFFRR